MAENIEISSGSGPRMSGIQNGKFFYLFDIVQAILFMRTCRKYGTMRLDGCLDAIKNAGLEEYPLYLTQIIGGVASGGYFFLSTSNFPFKGRKGVSMGRWYS